MSGDKSKCSPGRREGGVVRGEREREGGRENTEEANFGLGF